MPFPVDKVSILDYQFRLYYWKEKKNKEKHLKLQGSHKIGCDAHNEWETSVLAKIRQ